jgi:hypothetical protein
MSKKVSRNKKEAVNTKPDLVQLINQNEAYQFQSLVEISNQYGKLQQQYDQYEVVKKKLVERRNKIQKGEIKLPVQIQLSQNMYYTEDDKKEVLKILDDQVRLISNSLKGIEHQLTTHRDNYVEAGLRIKTFAETRFGKYTAKRMDRTGVNPTVKENTMFEAEFDAIVNDKKLQAQFKEAKARAVEENRAQK